MEQVSASYVVDGTGWKRWCDLRSSAKEEEQGGSIFPQRVGFHGRIRDEAEWLPGGWRLSFFVPFACWRNNGSMLGFSSWLYSIRRKSG